MSALPQPSSRRRAPFHCLALEGTGSPDSAEFQAAVWALYSVASTLRRALEHVGRKSFEVAPLEGIWSARRKRWSWKLVLPVPDTLTACLVEAAKFGAAQKRKNPAIHEVALAHLLEPEILHLMQVESWAADTDCAVERWAAQAIDAEAK